MRKAADLLDSLLGDLFNGRKKIDDPKVFVAALGATEIIQSTINIVVGLPGEEGDG